MLTTTTTLERPVAETGRAHAPVRVAIVGVNSDAGGLFYEAADDLGDAARLVAIVDPAPTEPWGRRRVVAAVPRFETLDALINSREEVDLLILAPSAEPAIGVVARALDRGWHVLCDQPFTDDVTEASRLVASALDRGLRLMLASPRRHMATPALELLRLGTLGAVGRVVVTWRHHGDLSTAVDQFGLLLGVALPLVGDAMPMEVSARRTEDATATVFVTFDGSASVALELRAGFRRARERAILTAHGVQATLAGELPFVEGAEIALPRLQVGVKPWRPISRFWPIAECYAKALADALDAIGGADPRAADPLGPIALGQAIRTSYPDGLPVRLP